MIKFAPETAGNMDIHKLYIRSSTFSLAAKLIVALSSLAVIWLITHITDKETFGLIMIAYALNYVLAAALATQFQTILMYHVARDHDTAMKNLHEDKVGASLSWVFVIGIGIAATETAMAVPLAQGMNKSEMVLWLSS